MNWVNLEHLLLEPVELRSVTTEPAMNHAQLCERALSLAAGLQARGIQRLAVHLNDAGELAIALLGAWQAGVSVLLPADLQPQTRQRWAADVDAWLTEAGDLDALYQPPLAAAALDLDACQLSLCTSGSSGEPKRIDKTLRQLANEVRALEALWGADLGQACIIGSVATQHIYGLLFRVLWPLCAGRSFVRQQLPFPEDVQRISRQHPHFAWVASPALLKRMGDNLDWAALSSVKRVFSSGGALPADAADSLHQRLQQWPTEILGSSETGGIAWRLAHCLTVPAGRACRTDCRRRPDLRRRPLRIARAPGSDRQAGRKTHLPAHARTRPGRARVGCGSAPGGGPGKPRIPRRPGGTQWRRPARLA